MILVHWITVVLIALAVAVALGREWLDGDLVRQRLLDLHLLLGLGVLGLPQRQAGQEREGADPVRGGRAAR